VSSALGASGASVAVCSEEEVFVEGALDMVLATFVMRFETSCWVICMLEMRRLSHGYFLLLRSGRL
jgi:hypothetical protein